MTNAKGMPKPEWRNFFATLFHISLSRQSDFLRHWNSSFVIIPLSVAFPHDEVQTAQHRGHVADHAARQELWQNTEVHKRWSANFQTIRHAAASAVDVKAKLALRIFGREVNFPRRRVESFRHHDEMMN